VNSRTLRVGNWGSVPRRRSDRDTRDDPENSAVHQHLGGGQHLVLKLWMREAQASVVLVTAISDDDCTKAGRATRGKLCRGHSTF